jgi:hypothetical protein
MYPAFYDPKLMKPSRIGIDYLLPIFTDSIGEDDIEHMRRTFFSPGNLAQPYHSINIDVNKRIRYLAAVGKTDADILLPVQRPSKHSEALTGQSLIQSKS